MTIDRIRAVVTSGESEPPVDAGERRTSAERQRAQEAGEALRALRARFGGTTIDGILAMRDEGRS